MTALDRCASFDDFRQLAKRRLPRILFDYIDGGSYAETTLARNVDDFQSLMLYQRVMKDMSRVSSRVSLFGHELSMPLILAPVGFAGMYARRGEVQAAGAASNFGIPFCLSTVGICSIEEVARDVGTAPWFQLYMIRDREWMASLLERAESAGAGVLILTADLQTPGARYRDVRSGMMRKLSLLEHLNRAFEGLIKSGWTWDVFVNGRPHSFGNLAGVLPAAASFSDAWQWISANFDPSVSWSDLEFIRQYWRGPIVIKGVMTEIDARLAVENGVDGIVVSNHGGRQLDGSPSTISVLPNIVNAVGDEISILLDSGIRSGLDVIKALQYGADACLIGRSWAFALAAGGQAGVERVLSIYQSELHTAQVLSGQTKFSGSDC